MKTFRVFFRVKTKKRHENTRHESRTRSCAIHVCQPCVDVLVSHGPVLGYGTVGQNKKKDRADNKIFELS